MLPTCLYNYGKIYYATGDIDDYIIGYAATFFQAIILGISDTLNASGHKKVFEDCIIIVSATALRMFIVLQVVAEFIKLLKNNSMKLLFIVFAIYSSISCFSQAGTIDESFGDHGKAKFL